MEALTKWIGSKVKFLDGILPLVPGESARYFEPFVGGGSLFLGVHDHGQFVVNDDCGELMELYREAARPTRLFLSHVSDINDSWKNLTEQFRKHKGQLVALYKNYPEGKDYLYLDYVKAANEALSQIDFQTIFPQHYTEPEAFEMEKRYHFTRMKSESKDRDFRMQDVLEEYILTSLKTAMYSYYTELYNSPGELPQGLRKALLLFLLHFSTNGQFTFDRQGEFRPVYAGAGHNQKTLDGKIELFASADLRERMVKTELHCMDFREFFRRHRPKEGDFVMMDPPLGTMCKKVGSKVFSEEDLGELLAVLRRCKAKWMLLVKSVDVTRPLAKFAEDYRVAYTGFHREVSIITNYDTKNV